MHLFLLLQDFVICDLYKVKKINWNYVSSEFNIMLNVGILYYIISNGGGKVEIMGYASSQKNNGGGGMIDWL